MAKTITIYDIDGNVKYTALAEKDSVRKFTLMEEDYIKLVFKTRQKVAFSLGDYIVHEDYGRFELTTIQKPDLNVSTMAYEYKLQFNAPYYKWANKKFKFDPADNRYETSFSLTAKVDSHMDVLLKNLTYHGVQYNGLDYTWDFNWNEEPAEGEEDDAVYTTQYITYDSVSIFDALDKIADAFEIEWWVTDNIIHLGRAETNGDYIQFEVGDNVSDIEANDTSGDDYFNTFIAFGSDRNLPYNYRKSTTTDEDGNTVETVTYGSVQKRLMLPTTEPVIYLDGVTADSPEEKKVEGVVVFDDVYPKTNGVIAEVISFVEQVEVEDEDSVDETTYEDVTFYRFRDENLVFDEDYILSGENLQVTFSTGKLAGMTFEVAFNPTGAGKSSDDYQMFEIVRNEDYGIYLPCPDYAPAVGDEYSLVGFDATKMTDLGLVDAAEQELLARAKAYAENLEVDPNNYECTMMADYMYGRSTAGVLDKSFAMSFALGDRIELVDANLFEEGSRKSRVIGYEYRLDEPYNGAKITVGENVTYSRSSAMEGEIDAKIEALSFGSNSNSSTVRSGGNNIYIITSSDSTPATDTNVFSAKRALNQFISKTSADTAQGLITFLSGISVGSGSYGIDALGVATLLELLAAYVEADKGKLLELLTNDIQSTDYQSGLTDGTGFALRNTADGSLLEVDKLWVRVKAVFQSLEIRKLTYAGGDNIYSCAGNIINAVQILYENVDESPITFEGAALLLDDETLTTTGSGAILGYRCYFLATDGEDNITNDWHVGDIVWSKNVNAAEATTYTAAEGYELTRNWKRVIYNVSDGPVTLSDGKTYHYFDLLPDREDEAYSITLDSGDLLIPDTVRDYPYPAANDKAVQMGSMTDTDRQYIYAVYVSEARRVDYDGVCTYDLDSYIVSDISPKGWKIKAGYIEYFSSGGTVQKSAVLMGAWTSWEYDEDGEVTTTGNTAYYYEEWTSNGQLWLCIYEGSEGVTTDPSTTDTDKWLLLVSKGDAGENASYTEYKYGISAQTELDEEGNLTINGEWADSPVATTTDYPYLWCAITPIDADGNRSTTTYVRMTGDTGSNGSYTAYKYGISAQTELNEDGTLVINGEWADSPVTTTEDYPYLWCAMTPVTYDSDGNASNGTTIYVRLTGEQGDTGVGVASVTEYYAAGTSKSTAPDTFSTDVPTLDSTNRYLWNYEVITYTNGDSSTSEARMIGSYSEDGKGISTVEESYGVSTSQDIQPTIWYSAISSCDFSSTNKYLWNKEITTYTDTSTRTLIHILAVYGETGDPGDPGDNGQSVFTSFVFVRSDSTPSTPTGGSFDEPVPDGWNDGIPTDSENPIWMSKRIFTSDGLSPQTDAWSTPALMAASADFDVVYCSKETYSAAPTGNPNTNTEWTADATDAIWMATCYKSSGVWSDWSVVKIVGENGVGKFKSMVFCRTADINTAPTTPTGGTWSNPIPDGDVWTDGIPDYSASTPVIWMSCATFTTDMEGDPTWSDPVMMSDTADMDIEYHDALSDGSEPDAPDASVHHSTSRTDGWYDTASSSSVWMAIDHFVNGAWQGWQVSRIQGEKGETINVLRIDRYYHIDANNSGITVDDFTTDRNDTSIWSSSVLSPTETYPYLWCVEETFYTVDGSTQYGDSSIGDPYVKGNYVASGTDAFQIVVDPATIVVEGNEEPDTDGSIITYSDSNGYIYGAKIQVLNGNTPIDFTIDCGDNDTSAYYEQNGRATIQCNGTTAASSQNVYIQSIGSSENNLSYTNADGDTDYIAMPYVSGNIVVWVKYNDGTTDVYRSVTIPFTVNLDVYTSHELLTNREWKLEFDNYKSTTDDTLTTIQQNYSTLSATATSISSRVTTIEGSYTTKEELESEIAALNSSMASLASQSDLNTLSESLNESIAAAQQEAENAVAQATEAVTTASGFSVAQYTLVEGCSNMLDDSDFTIPPTVSAGASSDAYTTVKRTDGESYRGLDMYEIVAANFSESSDSATYAGLKFRVAVESNVEYTAKTWIKSANTSTGGTAYLTVFGVTSSGTSTQIGSSTLSLSSATWKELSYTLTNTSGYAYLDIRICIAYNGNFYFTEPVLNNEVQDYDIYDTTGSTTAYRAIYCDDMASVQHNEQKYCHIVTKNDTEESYAGPRMYCDIDAPSENTSYTASIYVMLPSAPSSISGTAGASLGIYARKDGSRVSGVATEVYQTTCDGSWYRITATVTIPGGTDVDGLELAGFILGNGECYFSEPQIEKGTLATAWKQKDGDIESKLYKTGIDVTHRTIKMQADNFVLYNNDGDQTAGVDSEGNFTVSGVIKAESTYKNYQHIVLGGNETGQFGYYDDGTKRMPADIMCVVNPADNGTSMYLYLPWAGDCVGRVVEIYGDNYNVMSAGQYASYFIWAQNKTGSIETAGNDSTYYVDVDSSDTIPTFRLIGSHGIVQVKMGTSTNGTQAYIKLIAVKDSNYDDYVWLILNAVNCEFTAEYSIT